MGNLVTIRLEGLPADVEEMAVTIGIIVTIVEQSGDYANRHPSQMVRRYVKGMVTENTIKKLMAMATALGE